MQDIIEKGDQYFLPNLSIDLVIIGYEEGQVKCLLLQIGDQWVLPGGYIGLKESVDAAAKRILKSRTNLDEPHLKFLSVFGDKDRKFEQEFKAFFEKRGIPWKENAWIFNRFVTLAFYSLIDIETADPVPGEFDDHIQWHAIKDLPEMGLDHASIIDAAYEKLKQDIRSEPITYNLLPDSFTMPQLHELHQEIIGEKLDRSRFQKKMLSSGLFERLPLLKKETPGRKPYQYRVKKKD